MNNHFWISFIPTIRRLDCTVRSQGFRVNTKRIPLTLTGARVSAPILWYMLHPCFINQPDKECSVLSINYLTPVMLDSQILGHGHRAALDVDTPRRPYL